MDPVRSPCHSCITFYFIAQHLGRHGRPNSAESSPLRRACAEHLFHARAARHHRATVPDARRVAWRGARGPRCAFFFILLLFLQ